MSHWPVKTRNKRIDKIYCVTEILSDSWDDFQAHYFNAFKPKQYIMNRTNTTSKIELCPKRLFSWACQ
jgi:hypothetical protein